MTTARLKNVPVEIFPWTGQLFANWPAWMQDGYAAIWGVGVMYMAGPLWIDAGGSELEIPVGFWAVRFPTTGAIITLSPVTFLMLIEPAPAEPPPPPPTLPAFTPPAHPWTKFGNKHTDAETGKSRTMFSTKTTGSNLYSIPDDKFVEPVT